jgi:hypothetical protein
MIEDPEHPRMKQAEAGLRALVSRFRGADLTGYTIHRMMDDVKSHRQRWRNHGVDFPALVPLVNRRAGTVELVRADLDRRAIQTTVRNFIIKNRELSPIEVAQAIKLAWPDLPKGWLADTSEDYEERTQRSIERQMTETTSPPQPVIDHEAIAKAIELDPSLRQYYEEMN